LKFRPSGAVSSSSLVVYLHGAGERGNDLSLVTRYGLPAMLKAGSASVNCNVICPQLEAGAPWEPGALAAFINKVGAPHQKVSLIGFSLGASGVCNLASEHGAVVALFVSIAGQAPEQVRVNQSGVRLLAIQGELDPWPNTTAFLSSVAASGGEAFDIQLPSQGHFISDESLVHPKTVSMLQAAGVHITSHTNAG
jgi:poly(3-hydroxybutyrate) depolymerase